MEIVTNNGLGVLSFVALIYFMSTSIKDIKSSNEKISEALVEL